MGFQGQAVWVTGASSGIGEAIAVEMGRRGARVILSGRRREALEGVASRISGETLVLPFEATDFAGIPEQVSRAEAWSGGIDILINNAGISMRSLVTDSALDAYRRLFDVDVFAPVHLTQLVLPFMIQRGGGKIVVVSSLAGRLGTPLRSGYSAAKHAVNGFFESLRGEVEASHNISVTLVLPGFVRTNISANALSGDGSLRDTRNDHVRDRLEPEAVAAAIADALLTGRREVIVAGTEETAALRMRTETPEVFFDLMAAEGVRLAQARKAGETALRLEAHPLLHESRSFDQT